MSTLTLPARQPVPGLLMYPKVYSFFPTLHSFAFSTLFITTELSLFPIAVSLNVTSETALKSGAYSVVKQSEHC